MAENTSTLDRAEAAVELQGDRRAGAMFEPVFRGSRGYWMWLAALMVVITTGVVAYLIQFNQGFLPCAYFIGGRRPAIPNILR